MKQGAKNHATKRRKQINYKNRLKERIKTIDPFWGLGYIKDEGTKKERVKTYSISDKAYKEKENRRLRRDKENLYQNGEYRKASSYKSHIDW